MSDPAQTKTTRTSQEIWRLARRHAKEALAAIADHQMQTWTNFPTSMTPSDMITEAIVHAIEEAGVSYAETK